MFARVSTYTAPPDTIDAAVDAFETSIEALRSMEGIDRAYLLVDREGGKAMTITVWRSEEALAASADKAKELRSRAIGPAGGSVQSVETYELASQQSFAG